MPCLHLYTNLKYIFPTVVAVATKVVGQWGQKCRRLNVNMRGSLKDPFDQNLVAFTVQSGPEFYKVL